MQKGITKTTTEKLIEAETIIREFQAMRKLQIEYFIHGRKPEVLEKSKIQERKVDQMIKEYFQGQKQTDLFPENF